jgi:hypothetical protein
MRNGNKWTVNELLALQREYELLEWGVQKIADKHKRSVEAILFKLESEGFITRWENARGYNTQFFDNKLVDKVPEKSVHNIEYDTDIDNLTEKVWALETDVKQIGNMVKQMFDTIVYKKTQKIKPLRKGV